MTPTQRDMVRFRVLQALQNNPHASQRELSKLLGVSLGSVNYCIKAFIDKGLIKVENFINSEHKKGYVYNITPSGLVEKTKITAEYLQRKRQEYRLLEEEIQELQQVLQDKQDDKMR